MGLGLMLMIITLVSIRLAIHFADPPILNIIMYYVFTSAGYILLVKG